MSAPKKKPVLSATLLGFAALLFWSTVVAFIRRLVEDLGPFMFLAITSGCGGLGLVVFDSIRKRSLSSPLRVGWKNLLFCGVPFVGYFMLFALSMHLAGNRELAIQLGLVNYLWPALMLLLSVPLAGKRARWFLLIPGMILALGGATLGTVRLDSLQTLLASILASYPLFLMMLGAVLCWALYSVLIGKPEHKEGAYGVPLLHMLTGLAALFLAVITGENSNFNPSIAPALIYVTLFPTAIGYLWWEVGLKHGQYTLLNVASYALPVTATLFACWFLEVRICNV
jgi:drug/metabolite transporter (DMT)-like permease